MRRREYEGSVREFGGDGTVLNLLCGQAHNYTSLLKLIDWAPKLHISKNCVNKKVEK